MIKVLPLLSLFLQQDIDEQMAMMLGIVGGVIGLIFGIVELIAMWKIFTKAGKPGWAVLIPIYNTLVMLEIVGRPWWYLLLMLIPIVNFVILIMIVFDLAKSFGKSAGFAVGMIFFSFIFILILGFGKAQYVGPGAQMA
jgi:hypothetical protein